jgi:hypothetical protein
MVTNGSAYQGQVEGLSHVQGMIVKVKPQGDGTIRFDVTCHHANGNVAYRQCFLLPPNSPLQEFLKKGKGERARVLFEKTGKDRECPAHIELL